MSWTVRLVTLVACLPLKAPPMKLIQRSAVFSPSSLRPALLVVAAAVVLLSACGGKGEDKSSQTAAKVNKEEITVHQINFVLEHQPGLTADQTESASRQVLERLIDQELAVQKAQDLKLDRDPRVVQQVEAAKREILARAYVDHVGEAAAKPTADDVAKYYVAHPALFRDRRLYNLQELTIEAKPEQIDALRVRLQTIKNASDFADYLKAQNFHFTGNQAVRSAEQLPLNSLDVISKMKDGEAVPSLTPNGLQVLFLVSSRAQSVDEANAKPVIESFLLNQHKSDLAQKNLKALRDAAKIEYVGKFAEAAPQAVHPTSAPVAGKAEAPETAASGMDQGTIAKGMGIK